MINFFQHTFQDTVRHLHKVKTNGWEKKSCWPHWCGWHLISLIKFNIWHLLCCDAVDTSIASALDCITLSHEMHWDSHLKSDHVFPAYRTDQILRTWQMIHSQHCRPLRGFNQGQSVAGEGQGLFSLTMPREGGWARVESTSGENSIEWTGS